MKWEPRPTKRGFHFYFLIYGSATLCDGDIACRDPMEFEKTQKLLPGKPDASSTQAVMRDFSATDLRVQGVDGDVELVRNLLIAQEITRDLLMIRHIDLLSDRCGLEKVTFSQFSLR